MMELKITHISMAETKPKLIDDVDGLGKRLEAMAQKGAALGTDCGKMCSTCAFKSNQPHDEGYSNAVEAVFKVLLMGGAFNCHTGDFENADKPCAGFLYSQEYLKTIENI